jgi:hypothetical protein
MSDRRIYCGLAAEQQRQSYITGKRTFVSSGRAAELQRQIYSGSTPSIFLDLIAPLEPMTDGADSAKSHANIADSADSRADNEKKLPENSKVTELILRMNKKRLPSISNKELALEISDGNVTEANSLLRQSRRFRPLWKEAK